MARVVRHCGFAGAPRRDARVVVRVIDVLAASTGGSSACRPSAVRRGAIRNIGDRLWRVANLNRGKSPIRRVSITAKPERGPNAVIRQPTPTTNLIKTGLKSWISGPFSDSGRPGKPPPSACPSSKLARPASRLTIATVLRPCRLVIAVAVVGGASEIGS
jgi:hypothetical protein